MILQDLADITGAGATVPLSALLLKAKWIQIQADVSNGASVIRVGGPLASAARGIELGAGAFFFMPPISDMFEFYQLQRIYAYIPNGAVLHVAYAVDGSQS